MGESVGERESVLDLGMKWRGGMCSVSGVLTGLTLSTGMEVDRNCVYTRPHAKAKHSSGESWREEQNDQAILTFAKSRSCKNGLRL